MTTLSWTLAVLVVVSHGSLRHYSVSDRTDPDGTDPDGREPSWDTALESSLLQLRSEHQDQGMLASALTRLQMFQHEERLRAVGKWPITGRTTWKQNKFETENKEAGKLGLLDS